jgi:hypothetical protein
MDRARGPIFWDQCSSQLSLKASFLSHSTRAMENDPGTCLCTCQSRYPWILRPTCLGETFLTEFLAINSSSQRSSKAPFLWHPAGTLRAPLHGTCGRTTIAVTEQIQCQRLGERLYVQLGSPNSFQLLRILLQRSLYFRIYDLLYNFSTPPDKCPCIYDIV